MNQSNLRLPLASTGALVLAVTAAAYAGDFTPTEPVRPSAGWLNDYLRKDDPYAAAWDVGIPVRVRGEFKDGFAVPGQPGSVDFRDHGADSSNDYLLLKVRPHAGYTAPWFGVFVEGRLSSSYGDERKPNPETDGPLDLQQAYITLGNHKEFPVSLKVGRQELVYGDERLVGASAWNNIGRVFDTAKARWQNAWFAADFFSGRVVLPDNNNFNVVNDYDWFSGVYATTKKIPKQTTDLYFLSRNASAQAATAQTGSLVGLPSARDIYSIGLRVKSNPGDWGHWDYAGEFVGQFGHFNDPLLTSGKSLEHQAFAVFAAGGYTWTDAPGKPRLGLEYNFASGDSNPTDGKHGTFENLFPTNHKFYGYMDFVSLQNIHDIRLTSSIKPLPRLTLGVEYHGFWLADTHDSFYNVAGARRGTLTSNPGTGTGYGINPTYGSYVGSELDLTASYAISPVATLDVGLGRFFVGDYVQESLRAPTVGSKDANYLYLQMQVNF